MSFQTIPAPRTLDEARSSAQAAIASGDLQKASAIAASAVQAGLQDPLLFNLTAYDLEEKGRLYEALALLNRALAMAPTDPQILHAVGLCLSKIGNRREALVAFDAALVHRPGSAATLHHMGAALEGLGEDQAAERYYEAAVSSDPAYADPLAGLASLAARRGRGEQARGYAERALRLDPQQSTANVALAIADLADQQPELAESRLKALLANPRIYGPDRPAMLALLGDALQAQGGYNAAFRAYSDGKASAAEVFAPVLAKTADYAKVAGVVLDGLKSAQGFAQTPPEIARAGAPSTHVFLVGFPRSGTTLLGQVLASHPNVVTLDERTPLEAQNDRYLFSPQSYREVLAMDDAALGQARSAYWTAIAAMKLNTESKVLIDKLPLNTLKLPLIARLFPDAKILFALRDPRDVVWSCFRQSFQMNAAMAQFLTLKQTAAFYDLVMQIGVLARKKLPLAQHLVRYEALVDDLKAEMQPVCTFLGLEWDDAMRNFAAGAQERRISTPSAPQVRRGLYADGVGQWRPYAAQLNPIAARLEPWLEQFDYPK